MPLFKNMKWEAKVTLGDLVSWLIVLCSFTAYVVTIRNDVVNLQADVKEIKPIVYRHERNFAVVNDKLQLKDMQ